MEQSMGDMLRVSGLCAGYLDLPVVRDLSLSVPAGSVLGLVGPNGAGKTTAVSAMAGLRRNTGGTVHVDDIDCTALAAYQRARRGLALVQEGKRIFPQLTVQENLNVAAFSYRRGRRFSTSVITEVLDQFPALAERLGTRSGSLSGGQQQMLAIAQALCARPKVILVDEPSGGLAPIVMDDVFAILRSIAISGVAVLIVEQAIDRVSRIADQLAVLYAGSIVWSGRPDDPEGAQALDEAYFGTKIAAS
jgi:branched-chain amino acid transport system ATP-binding protein